MKKTILPVLCDVLYLLLISSLMHPLLLLWLWFKSKWLVVVDAH